MRLAPVALLYAHCPPEAIERAGESSRTTHGAREAIDGCRYLAALLVGALRGVSKVDLVSDHSFREGALLAVNLGDDADTTGAVYGQIAGAFYGAQEIPDTWLSKLAQHALIERYAENLLALTVQTAGT